MSTSQKPATDALKLFVQCLKKVPDPRSKQGTIHPSPTILAIILLGLLANVSTLAEIEQWTKLHFKKLSKFLLQRFANVLHYKSLENAVK